MQSAQSQKNTAKNFSDIRDFFLILRGNTKTVLRKHKTLTRNYYSHNSHNIFYEDGKFLNNYIGPKLNKNIDIKNGMIKSNKI